MVGAAGFDTFVAQGSVTSSGDVTLDLGRAFFLEARPYDGQVDINNTTTLDTFAPVIGSGGALEIDAPYIRFDSALQTISTPFMERRATIAPSSAPTRSISTAPCCSTNRSPMSSSTPPAMSG